MTPGPTPAPGLSRGDCLLLGQFLRSPGGVDVGGFRHGPGAEPRQVELFVRRLRDLGCIVEQSGVSGYKLVRTELTVWQEYLEHALSEAGMPRRVMVYRRIASTQDAVRDLADRRSVVLADEQTAGRGRRGRSWIAPAGSAVLFSLGHVMESSDDQAVDRVQCIAAVAVAQVIERLTGRPRVQIKWPNDIMVEGRKLAGILVETLTLAGRRVAVIGVGINVELSDRQRAALDPELRQRLTCLRDIGSPHDRLHVAAEVVAQLDGLLRSPTPSLQLDEWRIRNLMRSQRATFHSDGRTIVGEVVDLDAQAGLIVRTDAGNLVHLHAATTTVG